jgi:CIC family chloride channel protein
LLGAALGAYVARILNLSQGLTRTLLGCGVAAAVATAFNAPIAGVFFALEVVIGHYALSAFAPIVLASVTGTVISRAHYGDFPAFILPENFTIASLWEFPAFVLLGVASAVVAVAFMSAVMTADRLAGRSRVPVFLRPAIAGLAIGVAAIWLPQILGVGYETTDMALQEALPFALMAGLILAKIAATAICLAGGFGGGVFSPSLFIGAMTGGAFGIVATAAFPEYSSGHGAYTLVGMGAVAGAVLGAPISTILIVFEMTGDYELTIALMVAVVIASTVVDQTLGHGLFQWQLRRRGISLTGGRERRILAQVSVGQVMKRDYGAVAPTADLDQVAEKLRYAPYGEVFVMDDDNRLIGIVTQADLAHAEATESGGTAADIARIDPPILTADASLTDAMAIMDSAADSHIPVVGDARTRQVVGFVHEHDVMIAYKRALMQARAEERGDLSPPPAQPR